MVPEGSTIAPVIIATDKTQLAHFGSGRTAYPVYLTLGNIPRSIRRKPSRHACILIAYLPTMKVGHTELTKEEYRSRNNHIYHKFMRIILDPLKDAALNGVDMVCADQQVRWVVPILAAHVADYPEQCLISCAKYGTCPCCKVTEGSLGDMETEFPSRTQKDTAETIDDLSARSKSNNQFFQSCRNHDIGAGVYHPFWKDMPYTDIHLSMTVDVLHQLHQGVLKHLINWIQIVMTKAELDKRLQCLPPAYGVRFFSKGISRLTQMSGPERKQIARILLGCLIGKIPNRGIKACKAILDFIYLAQYSSHDNETLQYMEDVLQEWKDNRNFFHEKGA